MVAPKYPDKKFIIYDVSVPYDKCEGNKCANVYSVLYKQNEGSYLAGVYAALMSKTGIIGTVGGQDIPVINDFIVGYKQGARENGIPDDKVLVQYAGGWNDPVKRLLWLCTSKALILSSRLLEAQAWAFSRQRRKPVSGQLAWILISIPSSRILILNRLRLSLPL